MWSAINSLMIALNLGKLVEIHIMSGGFHDSLGRGSS